MANEGKRSARSTRLKMACASFALAAGCCAALAVAGCQPAGSVASDPAPESRVTFDGTFTQRDAGVWGQTQYAEAMNAGNRGCNSCHEDLFDVLPEGEVGSHEVYKEAAYGKVYTYNDCVTCHGSVENAGATTGGAGPFMATTIHGYHYGTPGFIEEYGGNCFSCHEVDVLTGELGMWDELKYTRIIGTGTNALGTEPWISGRGYETGTVTGGKTLADIKLDNVKTDQAASDAADLYGATNMDFPEIDESNYTVSIKGVKNERTFTLEELRAMPQTEITWTEMCLTNGQNGGWFATNIPTKGVLISDLVEACGGYADGVQTFGACGYDNWGYGGESSAMTPDEALFSIDGMLDPNAMVALQYWDENIDSFDGGPALFITPGAPATVNVKWVKEISFTDKPPVFPSFGDLGMNTVESAGWLTPATDGQTFKVGEPIELSGYAFAYPEQGTNAVESIKISADYGETWTTIELPEGYDEDQWVRWYAEWTPEAPGTYCLTAHCDSVSEFTAGNDGSVLITVTE